jgi:hypothetical protein
LIDDDFERPWLSDTQARLDVKFECALITDDEYEGDIQKVQELETPRMADK